MNADSDLVLPSGFRRVDMVRLITQCLTTLGYENAAQALQQESGMLLASEPIAHFRTAVLNGEWATAESLLDTLGFLTTASRLSAEWLVVRQKYLELLEASQNEDALHCLRSQLAPLEQRRAAEAVGDAINGHGGSGGSMSTAASPNDSMHAGGGLAGASDRLLNPTAGICDGACPANCTGTTGTSAHGGERLGATVRELSAYLMCGTFEVKRRTGWDGANGASRVTLMTALQQHIPPSVLLPDDRLQTLLQQAVMWQSAQCAIRPPRISQDMTP